MCRCSELEKKYIKNWKRSEIFFITKFTFNHGDFSHTVCKRTVSLFVMQTTSKRVDFPVDVLSIGNWINERVHEVTDYDNILYEKFHVHMLASTVQGNSRFLHEILWPLSPWIGRCAVSKLIQTLLWSHSSCCPVSCCRSERFSFPFLSVSSEKWTWLCV